MNIDEIGRLVEPDLLVLGGGLGGLFAAIRAREMGVEDVLVVDKAAVGFTNRFHFAGGYTIFLLPGDDPESWLKAFFKGQQGLCYQDKIESLLAQSHERLKELENIGLVYPREPNSDQYARMPSRGLGPVKMCLPPTFKNFEGGPAVTMALRNAAQRLGVKFLEKVFINDLVVEDNRLLGAVGCHRRTGEFYVFKCRALVLAAGDCSFRGNYAGVAQMTGDTFSMAYRAGADLANM
ncbi:MAG: FAD-binding protein, partial [Deltaproteobacteria bacterium]|nr:FAD-binding protein [Deltaproteobacteria bacterium]